MRSYLQGHPRLVYPLRAALILVALVIVWFVGGILGFSIDSVPRENLDAARQLWIQKGGKNYTMKVHVIAPPTFFGEYEVTVKDNKVVADNSTFHDWMSWYTVDNMFDRVTKDMASIPDVGGLSFGFCSPRLTIESDPNLGYIKTYRNDECQRGLLCGAISECQGGFSVSDLKLAPDQ